MTIERSGWYESLKNGILRERVHRCFSLIRLVVNILAVQLVLVGGIVLSVTYLLKNDSGVYIQKFLVSVDHISAANLPRKSSAIFKEARRLKTLNIGDSLGELFDSNYNGFIVVALTGLMMLILGIRRSRPLDFTCVSMVAVGMFGESREMKSFNNVLTGLQNRTMSKMNRALIDNRFQFENGFISTLDIMMLAGNCCGIVSGYDMMAFRAQIMRPRWQRSLDIRDVNDAPLVSVCWRSDYNPTNDKGCYVHYFEYFMKPFVRGMYGVAILTQVLVCFLMIVQMELPATKMDMLRILFMDRRPAAYTID